MVTKEDIRSLREKSGAGIMDCKHALEETQGDVEAAIEVLRRQGVVFAQETTQSGRATSQGLIEIYLHPGGRIGSMVEVNCETDFVARTDVFKELSHNLAMQIAAMAPKYLALEDMPDGVDEDPAQIVLVKQPFIKDQKVVIGDLVEDAIVKLGENIRVKRFQRFELGT